MKSTFRIPIGPPEEGQTKGIDPRGGTRPGEVDENGEFLNPYDEDFTSQELEILARRWDQNNSGTRENPKFMYPSVEEGGPRIPYWNQNPDTVNSFREDSIFRPRRGGRVVPPDEAPPGQPVSDRGMVEPRSRFPRRGSPRQVTDNRPTPM